jgi:hypothetical protein
MYSVLRLDYGNAQTVQEFTRRILSKIRIAVMATGDDDGTITASFTKVLTDAGLLPTITSAGNFMYTLKITVNIENAGKIGQYEAVRYTVEAVLRDVINDRVIFPFTLSGRESHTNQSEARRRAIRLINNEAGKSFAAQFATFLE